MIAQYYMSTQTVEDLNWQPLPVDIDEGLQYILLYIHVATGKMSKKYFGSDSVVTKEDKDGSVAFANHSIKMDEGNI
jgi:hypothetical protein